MKREEKICELRKLMQAKKIDAYIIPSGDQHNSEYPVDYWQTRAWISDFYGSAGTCVITAEKAGLWVDGRYHTQAEELVKNSEIQLFKLGIAGVLNHLDWLLDTLPNSAKIGIDGRQISVANIDKLKKQFAGKKIEIITDFDLIDDIWQDRPNFPREKIIDLAEEFAGKSRQQKFIEVRQEIKNAAADIFILSSLDDIAWLFNLRLWKTTPPFGQAFAAISANEITLFVDSENIKNVKELLKKEGINILDYFAIDDFIVQQKNQKIFYDPAVLNWQLFNLIDKSCEIIEGTNPTKLMKAKKNEIEIKNTKNAHIKDGIALTKFLFWLEQNVGKSEINEFSAAQKLTEFRKMQALNQGESFDTIAAYQANGAMMHYSATAEKNSQLKPQGFFLLDSGGLYLDGLTDTTRTIALGEISDEMKLHYTLALKGLINLSMAKFPKGTRGCNLDILARKSLWDLGLDYRCGTGHGVGFFLNVHEGPQSISQAFVNVPLELGMMTTIEPGFYQPNQYGIRIENIVLTILDQKTEYGDFYKFEFLTLCPIDLKPVIKEKLSAEEINYLNYYHQIVYEKLESHFDPAEKEWLKSATQKL